jgi:hypothetical protein
VHLIRYLRFLKHPVFGDNTQGMIYCLTNRFRKKEKTRHLTVQDATNVNKDEHKIFSWSVALTKYLFRIVYSAFVLYLEKIDGIIRSRK